MSGCGSVHLYEKPVARVFDIQITNQETRMPRTKVKKPATVPVWVFVLCIVICLAVALAALSIGLYTFLRFSSTKEAVAFHATLGQYDTITMDASVVFSYVDLNLGMGYSAATGIFTVPAGGGGVYNIQLHLLVDLGEAATFQIRQNGRELCRAVGDQSHNGDLDAATASCAASVLLEEGDKVDVLYDDGTDDTPLVEGAAPWQSFTGFRVTHY